ncbi:hypothetical protein A4A49_53691 [Nicotiana attenuata]|uniref:Retrotransposon gag domain-containing protein n=1 Tax=Nicotiana attenuata TaxID=49451 RepID=A0A1J6JTD7_NICAT|nr:hypothetical protein A4A49_53691 [Nicotiana attenuata]
MRDNQGNQAATGNFFTRYLRLKFPKFSGHDLKTWLYKVNQFSSMDEVPFDPRVKVTSIHLKGETIAWHRNLVQTGSVREYQAEFDRLLTGVNLSNENTIRLQEEVFEAQAKTWGLKPLSKSTQGGLLPAPNYYRSQNFHKPSTPQPTFKKPIESQQNKPNRIPGRRLTKAEMDDKRAKGLYFFCDEKYVPGHKCNSNRQIYMVEVVDEDIVVSETGESSL